jgi:hypothetical protein
MDESVLSEQMPYDLVVIPEQPIITAETVAKLEAFVRSGGKLLSTGVSITSPQLQNLLGIKLAQRGAADEGHVLLKNGDPAGIYASWDKLELQEASELYPLYLSWDHENPWIKGFPINYAINGSMDEESPEKAGFPGATVRKLGKGVAVHVPTDLFGTYWRFGYPEVLRWIREILDYLQPTLLFRTDALSFVELVLRRKGNDLFAHFINGNSGRDLSHVHTEDLFVDDIPPVGPINCWVQCAQKPRQVTWEPGKVSANVTWQDGVLKAVLPRLEIHTCLKIQDWRRPV